MSGDRCFAEVQRKIRILKTSTRKNVILGATGSVASIKCLGLASELNQIGLDVVIVTTQHAR